MRLYAAIWIAGCTFRPGAQVIDGAADGASIDVPRQDATVDACDPACNQPAASCNAILTADPSAASAIYVIDPDGPGPIAPFDVECDMTSMMGGWTLVARERLPGSATAAGPLRYLGVDSMNASALAAGTQSGIIGVRFAGAYADVMITWGSSYIRFAKPSSFDMFANVVNTAVDVDGYASNDTNLNSWVTNAGGARLCVASRSTDVRPGDNSWAIKPRDDNHALCGCDDPNWVGRGAYYGGTPTGQTSCNGFGGGWVGVKDNMIRKGGLAPTAETRIWIR